jgi:uncharacterized membrane protein HdeD (DUF308 family)
VIGLVFLVRPLGSLTVLTDWLSGYAIAAGAFLLVLGFRLHRRHAEVNSPLRA